MKIATGYSMGSFVCSSRTLLNVWYICHSCEVLWQEFDKKRQSISVPNPATMTINLSAEWTVWDRMPTAVAVWSELESSRHIYIWRKLLVVVLVNQFSLSNACNTTKSAVINSLQPESYRSDLKFITGIQFNTIWPNSDRINL